MVTESAECGDLSKFLLQLGESLDQYLRFEHPDAMLNCESWHRALGGTVPKRGVGIDQVVADMMQHLIPNGSQVPKPGCTAFITTGATSAGILASLSGTVAAPQRFGLTAFNYLEDVSLNWMAEMFGLSPKMQGLYSSGGSVANLVALGAARQWAFEKRGIDPARDGLQLPSRIYASSSAHHTIHRAAAVLGMGRTAVTAIPVDDRGGIRLTALKQQLQADAGLDSVPVAIVGNAGSTDSGAIDSLRDIGELAREFGTWFHADGAYGLPGILDPRGKHLYDGLSLANSVTIDPHKWLGAPVGIGATYVDDRDLLKRAFTQEAADYLEGTVVEEGFVSSMDSFGTPYNEYGVELSSPSRGAVVWALIREIGVEGLRDRVCRHNTMARNVAEQAHCHPNLEVVQDPTLSICCFRYVTDQWKDLNELNRRIHRQLVHNGQNIPSTTMVSGKCVIRPCFIGARTKQAQADALVSEVIEIGNQLLTDSND